jgi:hypothetical protein
MALRIYWCVLSRQGTTAVRKTGQERASDAQEIPAATSQFCHSVIAVVSVTTATGCICWALSQERSVCRWPSEDGPRPPRRTN